MKMAYIANIRLPTEKAHGIQIMEMCSAFARAGVSLQLVVPRRANPLGSPGESWKYYSIDSQFSIVPVPAYDPRWALRFPEGWYIRIQASFFMASFFRMFRTSRPVGDFLWYTRDHYLLPALFWMKEGSTDIVWEAHTVPTRARLFVRWWRRCRGIVALTRAIQEEIVACGIPREKVIVAHDGVSERVLKDAHALPQEEARRRCGLPLAGRIVMYTGSLSREKGVNTFCRAAEEYPDPQTTFVIVGGDAQQVSAMRQRYPGKNIIWAGYKPYGDIPIYLRAADALVIPNSSKSVFSRAYTSPMKLFEYMASGVPIAASKTSSIQEVITSRECFFFDPDSPSDLIRALEEMRAGEKDAQSRSRRAQERVRMFTWSARADHILSFIRTGSL